MNKTLNKIRNQGRIRNLSRENHDSKRYMYPNVHCSTIHNSQDMEATSMSIDRGVDKEDVVHIHSGLLLKRKEITTICSNMDGPRNYNDR